MTINIKEAQHPLKREKQVIDKSSIMLKISTKSMHRVLVWEIGPANNTTSLFNQLWPTCYYYLWATWHVFLPKYKVWVHFNNWTAAIYYCLFLLGKSRQSFVLESVPSDQDAIKRRKTHNWWGQTNFRGSLQMDQSWLNRLYQPFLIDILVRVRIHLFKSILTEEVRNS